MGIFDGGEKDPARIAAMFTALAPRYDLVNDLVSFGQNRAWRVATTAAVDPQPGERILDLAGGTGASAAPLAARGAQVTVCDISPGMIEVGRRRHPALDFVAADGANLPFADGHFDKATVTFGVRNMPDAPKVLRELARVVKPGGRLVICEFSHPVARPLAGLYRWYLTNILPKIAAIATGEPQAYRYFANSILGWPSQVDFANQIANNGWRRVGFRNLSGGIACLHRATR
ncbi:MAG: class I SAM-dependent methyltransferase [Cellulomonadaceae bacterium]|nr:class I SAM-dependent methyltransferase [Cellulomonadaceae bacterium]